MYQNIKSLLVKLFISYSDFFLKFKSQKKHTLTHKQYILQDKQIIKNKIKLVKLNNNMTILEGFSSF